MKLLLHICCGPCSLYPLAQLDNAGIETHGFFYNPNIHPYREFQKRMAGVQQVATTSGLDLEYDNDYGLTEYLRKVVFHEQERCSHCYIMRLEKTAEQAKNKGYEAFSTTLLYSKYQDHGAIQHIGKTLADRYQIEFYYQDFRVGWQEGIDKAIAMDIYRQAYCGCIYSEQERYDKVLQKKLKNRV